MKKLIKFLLLSPMILTLSGCGEDQTMSSSTKTEPIPVNVVLISGQSNGVGCTKMNQITRAMGSEKYHEYMEGYPDIQIAYDCWTKDGFGPGETPYFYSQNKSKDLNFVKVMLGQGNSLATFGPEIGIAEALHEEYAGKLFLIKFACGASNLKDDWTKRNSKMFPRLINFAKLQLNNLVEKGYAPTLKAFCWMQGEGDSYDGYYQEYEDNTREFVTNVREDLKDFTGGKELPFIDAGINNSKDPTTGALMWQYYREVNEAKKAFADSSENNFYIDTIAAGLHTDQEPLGDIDIAHYDSESQVQLGHLFAENFKQFLDK